MFLRRTIMVLASILGAIGCGGSKAEVEMEAPATPEAQQAMERMRHTQQEMMNRQKEMMERAAIPPSGTPSTP